MTAWTRVDPIRARAPSVQQTTLVETRGAGRLASAPSASAGAGEFAELGTAGPSLGTV